MNRSEHVFHYRLDTYWRSLAIYAVALLLYGVGRSLIAGTLQSDGRIEVVLADPIFWLLSAFVLVSAVALGINVLLQRRIVVLPDGLIFATRFRQRATRTLCNTACGDSPGTRRLAAPSERAYLPAWTAASHPHPTKLLRPRAGAFRTACAAPRSSRGGKPHRTEAVILR
ncbi:MAG: hypothetical protein KatS3mg040_0498 [Candidatus Kapaibacterium sp.]|nr:MAG: hypothetical protein KatS3mg040_0498 [Candidatus Kapabacteria bacterium]